MAKLDKSKSRADSIDSIQMLAIAIVLASLVLSTSIYFSASLLSRTNEQKTIVVNLPAINLQPVFNVSIPSGYTGGTAPAAAPYPAQAPSAAQQAANGCGVPTQGGAAAPAAKATVNVSGLPPKGAANAKVTAVIFSDYLCPFCKRAETTNAQILSQFSGKVNMVHMNLVIHGAPAHLQAEAAECAGAQGKFWEMHDSIFTDQKSDNVSLKAKASAITGIDTTKFNTCLDTGAMAARVDAQNAVAKSIGVSGTPSFVIGKNVGNMVNGQVVVGAQDISVFNTAINTALNG